MNTVESRGVSFDMLGLALLIVCAVAAVDVAWAEALGSSFRQETLAAMVCVAMLMMAAALHLGNDRFTTLASGYALMVVAWPALRVFNHLTFTMTGSMIDSELAQADAALGLSWVSYAGWLNDHPMLISVMQATYGSLTGFSIVAFIAVALLGSQRACKEFSFLFVVLAVTVSVLGIFFPAYGPAVHFRDIIANMANIDDYGWDHVPIYNQLRSGAPGVLQLERLLGLTTFPSFHTAMGILLVYALRERWVTIVPAAAYSGVMLAGTPLFGSHYFVDLLAGALLTAAAIATVRLCFAPSRPFSPLAPLPTA